MEEQEEAGETRRGGEEKHKEKNREAVITQKERSRRLDGFL